MLLVLAILVVVNLYVFVWDKKTGVRAIKQQAEAAQPTAMVPTLPLVPVPTIAAGSGAAPHASPSTIEGKVAKSDTLGRLLKKNGLTAAETDEVIHALSGVLDFKTIKAGEAFTITRGIDHRIERFDLELAKPHRVRAVRKPTGELVGEAL